MLKDHYDYTLHIDYAGDYIDAETKQRKPVLNLRCFIRNTKSWPVEKMGLNIGGKPSVEADKAIEGLSEAISRWHERRHPGFPIKIKEELDQNQNIKPRFERWIKLDPQTLMSLRSAQI